MSLLYRAENFVDSVIDSISTKINDYHLKKEYKKLEEENYKRFTYVTYLRYKLLKKYSCLNMNPVKSFGVVQMGIIKDLC